MNMLDNPIHGTRYIENQYLYAQMSREQRHVAFIKVGEKIQQPADIRTKNLMAKETAVSTKF